MAESIPSESDVDTSVSIVADSDSTDSKLCLSCKLCMAPIRFLDPDFHAFFDSGTTSESLHNKLVDDSAIIVDPSHHSSFSNTISETSVGGMGEQVRVMNELFELLTCDAAGDSDDDTDEFAPQLQHPLCEECADRLLNRMDEQIQTLQEECSDCEKFLRGLDDQATATIADGGEVGRLSLAPSSSDVASDECASLERERDALLMDLGRCEEEYSSLERELSDQRQKNSELTERESQLRRDYCELKREMIVLFDATQSVENRLRHTQRHLERLGKTNVLNHTFHIWYQGMFGTINGFRLGRMPNELVEWWEINAAWGQTALLLHVLASRLGLTFQRHRLVPCGNKSYLEPVAPGGGGAGATGRHRLPLYGQGGRTYLVSGSKQLDQAMLAFLDCLGQLMTEIQRRDDSFRFPYAVLADSIRDQGSGQTYSIRSTGNTQEQWTKALKFLLTNLKWAVAWVVAKYPTASPAINSPSPPPPSGALDQARQKLAGE